MVLRIDLDWFSSAALISEVCEGVTDICEGFTLVYYRNILLFVRILFYYEMIGYSQIGNTYHSGCGGGQLGGLGRPHTF